MAPSTVTDEDLAALIKRTTEAANAYIRGDMRLRACLSRESARRQGRVGQSGRQ